MVTKLDLTRQILAELGPAQDITMDQAITQWWVHSKPTGLRLTQAGHDMFSRSALMVRQDFVLPEHSMNARKLITLDRYLTCAYCLRRQRRDYVLTLFGSREAMMAALYGDIDRFIASLDG